jgi:hypothetical protein
MSGVEVAVLVAILVAIAALAPVFGADSRPTVQDPPEASLARRS